MEANIYLWVAAAVAIMSEIIALVPAWKSNSIVQLVMNIGKRMTGGQ